MSEIAHFLSQLAHGKLSSVILGATTKLTLIWKKNLLSTK